MNTKLAASILMAGALILPIAGHAADSDADRSSPGAYVKDSVITAKIKAELAEQKLSSLLHISVDTDKNGMVVLSGTATNQETADKAVTISRAVRGVTSVRNDIRVAGAAAAGTVTAARASGSERVEARIKDMHARLKITPVQEDQWAKVAQVMRDNAKSLDALTQSRFEHAKTMTAVEDLKSYGDITDAHADGIKKFTPVFATLYGSMSDAQKKEADGLFRNGGRRMSKVS
jgi:BON domain/LTXXQ motif family protein